MYRKILYRNRIMVLLIGIFLFVLCIAQLKKQILPKQTQPEFSIDDSILDFEEFDNENGTDRIIVPNIIHLLYFDHPQIEFYEMINIFAVYLNQKPDVIYMHCDNCSFSGKYWEQIIGKEDVTRVIKIHPIKKPLTIFGTYYGWHAYHGSDVYRLLVLMNYGGVYLDRDTYVINSLDKYRKYEMSLEWYHPDGIGNQLLIAHRNARLLKAQYDAYRTEYRPTEWYWNGGVVPATILKKHRNLAHIVQFKFGTHDMVDHLYKEVWPDWTQMDAIHLLVNHRFYLDANSTVKEFNETNILNYNYTYGYMARDVMKRMKLKF